MRNRRNGLHLGGLHPARTKDQFILRLQAKKGERYSCLRRLEGRNGDTPHPQARAPTLPPFPSSCPARFLHSFSVPSGSPFLTSVGSWVLAAFGCPPPAPPSSPGLADEAPNPKGSFPG